MRGGRSHQHEGRYPEHRGARSRGLKSDPTDLRSRAGGGTSGGDRTGGIAKESSPTEIRILAYPHLNTILLLKRTTKRNITQIQRNAYGLSHSKHACRGYTCKLAGGLDILLDGRWDARSERRHLGSDRDGHE